MEFVETPTFWCPHVDRAACTNFNLHTVKLRPPESREIFPFPFLLSHFPSFSLYELFSFLFLSSFPFYPFCFSILFLFSHLISLSFSPLFLLSLCIFSSFWSTPLIRSKEEISSPFPLTIYVAIKFPSLFLISLFPFYDIINYMAQCEPWDSFPTHGSL